MAMGPYDYAAVHPQPELEHPRAEAVGEGWTGWVVFAALVMLLLGLYHAFIGVAGLFDDSVPSVNLGDALLSTSRTAWGWGNLVLAVLYVLAGFYLLRGKLWARIVTIVVCLGDVVAQFLFFSVTPLWSLTVVTLGVISIYAVAVHGGVDTLE